VLASAVKQGGGGTHHALRFAGNGDGPQSWPLWLDVPADAGAGALRLEMAASMRSLYQAGAPEEQPEALLEFVSAMPPWTSVAATESFQSAWAFP